MASCGGSVQETSKCGCEGDKKIDTPEDVVPEVALQEGQEETGAGGESENGGCKCAPTCNCDPCTCK